MKKIRLLSLFLLLSILFSVTAMAAPSQGFVWNLETDKTTVSVGESVEVKISLAPSADYYEFNSAEVYFSWDPAVFEVSGVKAQNLFKASALAGDTGAKDHVFINRYTNSLTSMISWNEQKQVASLTLTALKDGACTAALSAPQITQTVQYQPKTIPASVSSSVYLRSGSAASSQVPPVIGDPAAYLPGELPQEPTVFEPVSVKTVEFADVPASHWAHESVRFCCELGLFTGTSATTFSPDGAVTRGMFMTVLARAAGVDTEGGESWYEKGRQWAMENEISDGSNPELPLTREQLVTMLYRFCGSPMTDGTVAGYPDAAEVSDFSREALGWAIHNGILTGINGNLSPKTGATRAQLAAILMRWSFAEY